MAGIECHTYLTAPSLSDTLMKSAPADPLTLSCCDMQFFLKTLLALGFGLATAALL